MAASLSIPAFSFVSFSVSFLTDSRFLDFELFELKRKLTRLTFAAFLSFREFLVRTALSCLVSELEEAVAFILLIMMIGGG